MKIKRLLQFICKHQWQLSFDIVQIQQVGQRMTKIICVQCEKIQDVEMFIYKDQTILSSYNPKKCGKNSYKSKKDAQTVLNFARYQKRVKRAERVYLCPDCSGWHLTSKL